MAETGTIQNPNEAKREVSSKKTKKPLNAAQKKKKQNLIRSIVRAGIQIIFFLSMPGAFVAGWGGIKSIFQKVGNGSMIEMNSFVKALVALALFTVIFGRFFCGYACAFGSLGDLIFKLSELFQKKVLKRKKVFSIPLKVLPWLQKLKYLNLIFVIVGCTFGWYASLKGTSPWDVFSVLTALRMPGSGYTAGIVCLILIIIGMGVQSRFFCQFLCPMGAFFALLPHFSKTTLQRDPDNCLKKCDACRKQCPVGLKLEPDGFRNGECIQCGKCAGVCPKSNLCYPALQRTNKSGGNTKPAYLHAQAIGFMLFRGAVFFALGCFMGWCRFF